MSARPTIFTYRYPIKGQDSVRTLPLFAGKLALTAYHHAQSAHLFLNALRLNRHLFELLNRLPSCGLQDWWLTAGCLVQTVWNVRSGRPAVDNVLDYDLFYFDPDLSWKAEDCVIRFLEREFSDLPIQLQPRNQARVHLWYESKFGFQYRPVRSARHSLRRFPTTTTAVGITSNADGVCYFYAPFGLTDALNMIVRPNRRLPIHEVYEEKVLRWQSVWTKLTVHHWNGNISRAQMAPNADDVDARIPEFNT
jgi:hypothetical protein